MTQTKRRSPPEKYATKKDIADLVRIMQKASLAKKEMFELIKMIQKESEGYIKLFKLVNDEIDMLKDRADSTDNILNAVK